MMTTEKMLPVEADLTLLRSQMPSKRRQNRRHRCNLATMAKLEVPTTTAETLVAWVYNLSLGGAGLNSQQALEVGQELVINFRVPGAHAAQPARVVFCKEEADRTWRVGCEFHESISHDLLEALLG